MSNKKPIQINSKVFVILVNYSQAELTLKCIQSIQESSNIDPQIIVVDNCSPDDSYSLLKEKLDQSIILIKANANNGFASGNNIGIRYALGRGADYIMLLNNDTEIAADMIEKLLLFTDEKTATAPKMYYFDRPDTIWFAGGRYLKGSGRFIHIGENQNDSPAFDQNTECDFLTGCCIMLSAKTVQKVGLLSEEYFMYVEDVDYSLRLKEAHVQMLMIPEAKLWHKVGSSSGGERSKAAIYYGNRNRLYLQKKFLFNPLIRFLTLSSRLLLLMKGILFKTKEAYIAYSIIDYLNGITGKSKRSL